MLSFMTNYALCPWGKALMVLFITTNRAFFFFCRPLATSDFYLPTLWEKKIQLCVTLDQCRIDQNRSEV